MRVYPGLRSHLHRWHEDCYGSEWGARVAVEHIVRVNERPRHCPEEVERKNCRTLAGACPPAGNVECTELAIAGTEEPLKETLRVLKVPGDRT
jgi:hypothetical protein